MISLHSLQNNIDFILFSLFFVFSRATPMAYGGSQARGLIGIIATDLCQSHRNVGSKPRLRPTPPAQGNARSELRLRPTPQLTTTSDL